MEWKQYNNSNSGIVEYRRIDDTKFSLCFKDNMAYDYEVESKELVDKIIELAESGKGLNTFVNKNRSKIYLKYSQILKCNE